MQFIILTVHVKKVSLQQKILAICVLTNFVKIKTICLSEINSKFVNFQRFLQLFLQ